MSSTKRHLLLTVLTLGLLLVACGDSEPVVDESTIEARIKRLEAIVEPASTVVEQKCPTLRQSGYILSYRNLIEAIFKLNDELLDESSLITQGNKPRSQIFSTIDEAISLNKKIMNLRVPAKTQRLHELNVRTATIMLEMYDLFERAFKATDKDLAAELNLKALVKSLESSEAVWDVNDELEAFCQ